MNLKKITIAFSLFLITLTTRAQVILPAIFSDNMVLQRGKPVPVWGKATAGELVTVSFASQTKSVTTDSNGNWQLILDEMIASATPNDLLIKSGNTIAIKNILVGDVWLCTGQSNMEYPLDRALKKYAAPKKGTDLSSEELPKIKPDAIRYLYVEKTLNKIPLLPTKGWTNGNDTLLRYASAIGYFFAKEIHEKINVPIGIISSSWGGTRIEQWTPDWAWERSPVFKDSVTSPNFKIDGMHPGQMYNGLIEPLIPFAVKGVLWYQGESNCAVEDQVTYPDKMELFVNTWRSLFKDAALPFYYVQIAPYLYSSRKDPKKHTATLLPVFWEAQTKSLSLNHTAMVVTTDLVDNLSDIHPSYKWEVGHRLALVALAKSYNQTSVVYSGPTYQSAKRKKKYILLSFKQTGGGLATNDGKPLNWFSIAGDDGQFVTADAVIKGNEIKVSSTQVPHPRYVRFAWDETAQPNFINKEGLPAAAFRTDHLKTD